MNAPPAARRTPRPVLPPTHGVPMQVGLLEQVMRLEVQAYPFPWSRGNFVDSIAAGYWSHCRITEEGLLIGYMVALRSLEEWHLLNLTVDPRWQGLGLGRRMLERLAHQARSESGRSLWLEVRPSNLPALALYERFGFQQVGRRKNYYPDHEGRREDALVLSCMLASGAGAGAGAEPAA